VPTRRPAPLQFSNFRPIVLAMRKQYHWISLVAFVLVLSAVFGLAPDNIAATKPVGQLPAATLGDTLGGVAEKVDVPLPLPPNPSTVEQAPTTDTANDEPTGMDEYQGGVTKSVIVQRGENLARIFKRLGISARELQQIVDLGNETASLKRLFPGERLQLTLSPEQNRLERLSYDLDVTTRLHVYRQGDQLKATVANMPLEKRLHPAVGVIDSSLYAAATNAGLPDNLVMELAQIFGWDIDFALDIRNGDSFTVLFEELYRNGEKVGYGDIVAAEFVNRDKAYRAVRYEDGRYYTPDGHSMRKEFLRTPVEFTRISSRFSLGRRHPILHHIRAHKGVDYAAPVGTPVKATGDGKVIFLGRNGGYGNVVMLQHGQRYTTVYAHLSRYARHLHRGSRVKQGQIIAYVGKTGLATGPHLHYEFRVNGVHRNPLTVKLPTAAPIRKSARSDFIAQSRPLLAQLDTLKRTVVALSGSPATNNN